MLSGWVPWGGGEEVSGHDPRRVPDRPREVAELLPQARRAR